MNFTNKNHLKNRDKNGFSLLEIIVAMAIIVSGVISSLTLFSYNLKIQANNKNKLIATYLAQEAIEIVRQTRDNICFKGDSDFLDENEFRDRNYIIIPKDEDDLMDGWEMKNNININRRKVYKKNGYYIQRDNASTVGVTETGFTRYLEIADGSDGSIPSGCDIPSCARIISHVSFNGEEVVVIIAYLYDEWY